MKHAAALFVMFAIVGCQKPPSPAAPAQAGGAAEPATQLPDENDAQPADDHAQADKVTVEIKDFDGIQELIASKRGKVVVMDCWSTYCGPCVKEFPGLVALGKEYGPDKLACISLSFNFEGGKKETPEEHKEAVLEFLQSQQATFDNVIASVPSETLYQQLGFKSASVPAIFVYDREGNIARQFEGGDAKYSDVGKLVAKLLE
ncbi:MAG TPA: TlpA disulfide reductase family protein [Pirellulales bacterium]|nr:TlpA disulfide reductase family protein [Pirellulales bacterium]